MVYSSLPPESSLYEEASSSGYAFGARAGLLSEGADVHVFADDFDIEPRRSRWASLRSAGGLLVALAATLGAVLIAGGVSAGVASRRRAAAPGGGIHGPLEADPLDAVQMQQWGAQPQQTAFDCNEGFAAWQDAWQPAKKVWCCANFGKGCVVPGSDGLDNIPPQDCNAGWANWQAGWSDIKKRWCCRNQGKACEGPTPRPEQDCTAGWANWQAGWSVEKKTWCCVHEGKACPTTTTVAFDCNAGWANWANGWTAEKKTWCCQHDGRGCDPGQQEEHNCADGFDNWMLGWSHEKKHWCCQYYAKGCTIPKPPPPPMPPTAPPPAPGPGPHPPGPWPPKPGPQPRRPTTTSMPYDCWAGWANWQAGWSVPKKFWCCQHQGKGCPTNNYSPYDCNAGWANWQAGWSEPKKHWCCEHWGRGCPPTTTTPPGIGVEEYKFTRTYTYTITTKPTKTKTTTSTTRTTTSITLTWTSTTWTSTSTTMTTSTATTTATWTWTTTSITHTSTTMTFTSTTTQTETVTTTTTTIFHCDHEDFDSWSDHKRMWCCEWRGRGCTTTTARPFICHGDPDEWQDPGKRAWCCIAEGKGCDHTTTALYSCNIKWEGEECTWTQARRTFCCQNHGVACPHALPFDCEAGYANWESGWSDGKQAWCCLKQGRGCKTTTPNPGFDCTAGLDTWQTAWSVEQRDWCCEHEDRGCYHCAQGLGKNKDGWAPGKKDWCCRHFGRGCDDAMDSTSCKTLEGLPEGVFAEGKREWCCRRKNELCDAPLPAKPEPYACEADVQNKKAWDVGKRAWCCLNHEIACEEEEDKCNDGGGDLSSSWPPWSSSVAPGFERGSCLLWGDPHVETFDHTFPSFLAEGEYWIVKSPLMWIQGRYLATEFTNGLSALFQIAITGTFMDNNKVIIGPLLPRPNGRDRANTIRWNGEEILTTFPSSFDTNGYGTISYTDYGNLVDPANSHLPKHIVHLDLPLDTHIQVMRWDNHINVRITMRPIKGQDGHCGNFNHNPNDDSQEQIQARIGGRVPVHDLIFRFPVPVGPPIPKKPISECDPGRLRNAQISCNQALNHATGPLMDDCVYDVCFARDTWADQDGLIERESPEFKPSYPLGGGGGDFDCNAGWAQWQAGWSDEKKAFCCSQRGKGCNPGPPPANFDCNAGWAMWQTGWSTEKKTFCCTQQGKGCEGGSPGAEFDCSAGLETWYYDWSASKKDWCCTHVGKGCPWSSVAA